MDRKKQIEKIILKELHDKEIMEKVRLINERSHRPQSRRIQKTKEEIKSLGGDPSAFKGTLGHLTKAKENLKQMQVNSTGGDDSSEKNEAETLTPNQQAEIKQSELAKQEVKKTEREKNQGQTTHPSAIEQENTSDIMTSFIRHHAGKLKGTHRDLRDTEDVIDTIPAPKLTNILNDIDKSHPHLNIHTRSLRSIIGL